jgi:transcriptional regulator with XRE-family HTH domain
MSRVDVYPPNQVRRFRKERGLRLRDMMLLTGAKSPAHFSHWEKGRKLPNLVNALKLSAVIQCPVEVLFAELFASIRSEVYARKQSLNIKLKYD